MDIGKYHLRTSPCNPVQNQRLDLRTSSCNPIQYQRLDFSKQKSSFVATIRSEQFGLNASRLLLLKKLNSANKTRVEEFKCHLSFVDDLVVLTGPEDVIDTVKLNILALVSNDCSCNLSLSKSMVKLLRTTTGTKWVEEQFDKCQSKPIAVLYARDNNMQLAALDESTLNSAKKTLLSKIKSERLPFTDQHLKFLQSVQWSNAVSDMELKDVVNIFTVYEEKYVFIDGSSLAVDAALVFIKDQLKDKPKSTRSLKMASRDVVKLLKNYSETIKLKASQKNR